MTTLGSGTNEISPFATGVGANVESPSDWAADATRQLGFQIGIASPTQANTVFRQTAFVSAMLAQFIADFSGATAADDGDVLGLEQKFIDALQGYFGANTVYAAFTDTGSANAIEAVATPALTSYAEPSIVIFRKKSATPNTDACTCNFGGGVVALKDNTGADLTNGTLLGGAYYIASYTGSQFVILGGATSYTNVTSLTANSGAMIEVEGGSGIVNFRTARGTHNTTVNSGDKWPRGDATTDDPEYMTTTEFISWLEESFNLGETEIHQYPTAGTYNLTVPAWATRIRARIWGAGGAGGNGENGGAGAGGGGGEYREFSAYVAATEDIRPGDTLTLVVGAGGAVNSAYGGAGNPGASSSLSCSSSGSLAIAVGGGGGGGSAGVYFSTAVGAGGYGGAGNGFSIPGTSGGAGNGWWPGTGGGAFGTPPRPGSFIYTGGATAGIAGAKPGGGGQASGGTYGTFLKGGAGADGRIDIVFEG